MTDPIIFPAPPGGSPIGSGGVGTTFDIGRPPFPWQSTIISQYATATKFLTEIASLAAAIDQQQNIDNFYDLVWNIQTAQGYGLDVLGRIVVVSRTLQITTRYFGFDQGLPDVDPFNTSPFYSGEVLGSSYTLGDDAYRLLILAKALKNITRASAKNINAILQLLFARRGPCYVTDNGDMTMTYTTRFLPAISPLEIAIFENSNVLPRPSGVKILYDLE